MPHDVTLIATFAVAFVLASVFGYIASRLRLPPLVGYLVAVVVLIGLDALAGLPDQTQTLGLLILHAGLGVFAGDIRSWTLSRRGFRLVDVVTAESEDAAARRFYDRWLSPAVQARAALAAPSRPAGPSPYQPVVGLFPEAGRS